MMLNLIWYCLLIDHTHQLNTRQSLLGMNKIGLPVTNLPSSWCIYTNRERSAQACPHFIVNTNTPGVDGVSSCGKHTKGPLHDPVIVVLMIGPLHDPVIVCPNKQCPQVLDIVDSGSQIYCYS